MSGGWIDHDGGDCPVDGTAWVEIETHGGSTTMMIASAVAWRRGTTIWETGGDPLPRDCQVARYRPVQS